MLIAFACGGRRFAGGGGDAGPAGPQERRRNLCLQYGSTGDRYCTIDCNNDEWSCPAGLNATCISGSDVVEGTEVEVRQCISIANPPCPAGDVDAPFCVPCNGHAECLGANCAGVGLRSSGCDPQDDFVDCGSGACCTDLLFDEENCGACGRACEGDAFCFGGVCHARGGDAGP